MAKKVKDANRIPFQGFINAIEKIGNKMPHPVFLFVYLGLAFIGLSVIGAALGATNPMNTTQQVKSLLSFEGIYYMFTQFINNFSTNGYSAGVGGGSSIFGTIILLTMAVGIGTSTGFWNSLIKKMTLMIPKGAVSYIVVFIGGFSSIASDAGYVVFIPLAAIIFKGYGRHPIAGIAAAFAGVSAGFSATLLPGASDAIFSGIWKDLADQAKLPGDLIFTPTSMWFFQIASLFLISFVGGIVTDRIVEPSLRRVEVKNADVNVSTTMSAEEKRGLKFSNIAVLITLVVFAALAFPGFGPLANKYVAATGEYIQANTIMDWARNSIFMKSISLNLGIIFFVAGVSYGYGAGSIQRKEDIVKHEVKSLSGIASYIVVTFVALNAVQWFSWTNLGVVLTGYAAKFIENSGMGQHGMVIILSVTLIITIIANMLISGMSSKAYILGPVFLALIISVIGIDKLAENNYYDVIALGVAYRIGDSVTNIITPIMSYFVIILAFAEQYVKNEEQYGVGQLIATMMPYSIVFTISWIVLFVIWYAFKIPFGLS